MVIHACIFRKSSLLLIMVGEFQLKNVNNKASESQARGNTRECGQTLRFVIHVLNVHGIN